ncbi:hypothetical protein E0L36_08505 [Streptomyces sp. AJS327]|uniref:VOC family protein n=1 Tax=Streptomyces sp. AJS327 TaxID=2545265 RepID=UPI0015DF5EAC|nr:VOC family protein [Streptomyces sp. AJS327]MBA0050933.1 hypothetical protein [Streptomyces sp. AJS327]
MTASPPPAGSTEPAASSPPAVGAAAGPGGGPDLDHTSFAVHDALGWARRLRRELGATPITGEVLAEFRYLLLYAGSASAGARLELMEPTGAGFLAGYLAKRGEGPHHLTFTVPDLRAAVARARAVGADVVGESYHHPPWREAFIRPDGRHGVVVQLAQSDRAYPAPGELLASRDRDPETLPSVSGATEPLWWTSLWETVPGPVAELGATRLASTDPEFSRRLFGDVLGGAARAAEDHVEFAWPSGSVRVFPAERPGVRGVDLPDGRPSGPRIGPAAIGPD